MSTPGQETAASIGLQYVTDSAPGISRRKTSKGFVFRYPDGRTVKNSADLARIRKLAIPPAYEQVWICLDPRGHLQATGVDARGRKQYRYHEEFRAAQEELKFHRMREFGRALPSIREKVEHDLLQHGLPKTKVLAAVVYLLEHSLVRIGNQQYARENHSYGLTTMRSRHVKVQGANVRLHFVGKSRILHDIEVHDRRLATVIKKLQDLPGQDLFQYSDGQGSLDTVTSADVNAYLHAISGEHFTAKDFRTWSGSVLALVHFAEQESPETPTAAKHAIMDAMKSVSKQLGNTPAICRKCYVHPSVFRAFQDCALSEALCPDQAETALLQLLASEEEFKTHC